MYTLELGQVNAGAIFFAVVLLSTLAFGRFFCGWGCHLVALQDLCAWLMRRCGVEPRPVRSRFVAWVPAALAFYMFAWPSLSRWLNRETIRPAFSDHLITSDFWATFPGPVMAVLTLAVCGFVCVYVLGAKGFCTYGCPYGSLFGAVDRASPARILVSDACTGCGQCTAHCTSNVQVASEVREFGMVVDSGCMKCLDCVSVCPTSALRYGFTRPPLFRRRPAVPTRSYELSWRADLLLLAISVVAMLAYRGVYDGPPLLLAGASGVLTGVLTLRAWQWTTAPRGTRRLAPAALVLVWLLFTAHCGYVQWHRHVGRHYLQLTGLTWPQLQQDPSRIGRRTPSEVRAASAARDAFAAADRWGLVPVLEVKLGRAWVAILDRDHAAAERALNDAIAVNPRHAQPHQFLIEYQTWRGDEPGTCAALEQKIREVGPSAQDDFFLANIYARAGLLDLAIRHYLRCIEQSPEASQPRHNLGGLLRRSSRYDEATGQLEIAHRLAPDDASIIGELCLSYIAQRAVPEARRTLAKYLRNQPAAASDRDDIKALIDHLKDMK